MKLRSIRVRRLVWLAAATCIAIAITASGCGGSSRSPTGSSGAPTPAPTPTPRQTFSLDAPPDSGRYSTQLAKLEVGASITLDFRPIAVNAESGEKFGHSIEFWLFADRNGPIDLEQRSNLDSALSFVWRSGSQWTVSSVIAESGYESGPRNVDLPLGTMRSIRVRRTREGTAEYFLDGELILTLPNPPASSLVFVRTYGAWAEFSYVPGVFGSSTRALLDSPWELAPSGRPPGSRPPSPDPSAFTPPGTGGDPR